MSPPIPGKDLPGVQPMWSLAHTQSVLDATAGLEKPRVVLVGAGFIGFHTSKRLLDSGYDVVGLDNINDYYDVNLKKSRLNILQDSNRFAFYNISLEDFESVAQLFKKEAPQRVIHLAAQAGVRYSIEHPEIYIQSNIIGTFHILECCRYNQVEHLVYASTSSSFAENEF